MRANVKLYHNFLIFTSILIILIPPALISGPFLPDFFITITSIIILYFERNIKESNLFKTTFFKLFIIFYIYLILISVFSDYFYQSLKPSVTYLRFGLFSLSVLLVLENIKNFKFFFFIVLSFTICALLIDGYFQFIIGKNIFGYEVLRPDRLSSLFFDELILGSYLGKILPIFCCFYSFNKKHINEYFIIIFILLIYILIFLSGERAAFLTTTLYIVMVLPFFLNLKKGLSFLLCIVIILGTLVSLNENIKSRYYDQMIAHIKPNVSQHGNDKFLPEHRGLFISAIEIFKKNIFLGGGLKSFRIICKDLDNIRVPDYSISNDLDNIFSDVINQNDCAIYKTSKNCSTHPHNYYLQLLSETGLFGFIFVFTIFLKLLFNYFQQIYYLLRNKNKINISNNLILCGLISYIWPIITTGSFFNNWICSILFLQVGIYLYTLNYFENK